MSYGSTRLSHYQLPPTGSLWALTSYLWSENAVIVSRCSPLESPRRQLQTTCSRVHPILRAPLLHQRYRAHTGHGGPGRSVGNACSWNLSGTNNKRRGRDQSVRLMSSSSQRTRAGPYVNLASALVYPTRLWAPRRRCRFVSPAFCRTPRCKTRRSHECTTLEVSVYYTRYLICTDIHRSFYHQCVYL